MYEIPCGCTGIDPVAVRVLTLWLYGYRPYQSEHLLYTCNFINPFSTLLRKNISIKIISFNIFYSSWKGNLIG